VTSAGTLGPSVTADVLQEILTNGTSRPTQAYVTVSSVIEEDDA